MRLGYLRTLALALTGPLYACGQEVEAAVPDRGATDRDSCPMLTQPLAMAGDDIDGDTWASWARDDFFGLWCTRCHSTTLVGDQARHGAPADFDWDDEASLRTHLAEIRNQVGVTHRMPFTKRPGDQLYPTCTERARLVRWIDAQAP